MDRELQAVEESAYRRAELQDGVVDIVSGLGLVAWGALLLSDLGGLGGVPFAIFLPVALVWRRRMLEARLGHVQLDRDAGRRRKLMIGALFATTFVAAVGAYVAFEGDPAVWKERLQDLGDLALGLMLALVATVVGFAFRAPRAHLYAATTVAIFLAFRAIGPMDGAPGPALPTIASGLVPTITGVLLLARFLRRHPEQSTPEGLFDAADRSA